MKTGPANTNGWNAPWLVVPLAFVVILLSGCAQQAAMTKSPSKSGPGALFVSIPSSTYVIKKGDQVDVSVWGYPEFNTTAVIKDGGTLLIPLVGEVKAEGSTKEQLRDLLKTKLSQYIQGEFKVNVTVSGLTTLRVSVLGAVNRQENYPVNGDVSLLDLLSSAGGPTPDSDLRRVKVIRPGLDQASVIDIESFIDNGTSDTIPMIHPGDIVFVPKQENVVHIFSDFLRDVVLLFGFFRVFN